MPVGEPTPTQTTSVFDSIVRSAGMKPHRYTGLRQRSNSRDFSSPPTSPSGGASARPAPPTSPRTRIAQKLASRRVDDAAPAHVATAGALSTVATLGNNLVGVGPFTLPWVLRNCTVLTGLAVMALVAAFNATGMVVLALCADKAGSFSFLGIGRRAFGRRFGVACQFVTTLYAGFSCVQVIVLASDFLEDHDGLLRPPGPDGAPGARSTARTLVCMASVLFPLSMLRNLAALKASSSVAIVVILFGTFRYIRTAMYLDMPAAPDTQPTAGVAAGAAAAAAAARAAVRDSHGKMDPGEAFAGEVSWLGFPLTIFAAFPVLNVGFCAHYSAPRYYEELKDRSPSRFAWVVSVTMLMIYGLYAVVGIAGYLVFGDRTAGDIMTNLEHSPLFGVGEEAELALLVLVVVTFPLAHHCFRAGVIALTWGERHTTNTLPFGSYAPLTVATVFAPVLVGVCVGSHVEVVLAYKGAILGSCIVYIFPALMYAALALKEQRGLGSGNASSSSSSSSSVARTLSAAEKAPAAPGGNRRGDTMLQALKQPPTSSPRLVASESGGRKGLSDAAWAFQLLARPPTLREVVVAMFRPPLTGMGVLACWGVVTGLLGVGVTVMLSMGMLQ